MTSFLTINDYFNRSGAGFQQNRKARLATNNVSPRKSDFANLFRGLSSGKKPVTASTSGLSLSDYRKHVIKAIPVVSVEEKLKARAEMEKGTEVTTEAEKTEKPNTESSASEKAAKLPATCKNEEKETSDRQKIDAIIKNTAQKYDLKPTLIKAVIKAESDFNPDVVSRAGAQGLMQLMPETSKDLGVSDPFDVEQNIDGGVRYLRQMMDQFNGNVRLALAAYNAGPGAVERYQGIPPYEETIQYVQKVLKFSR